MAKTLETTPLTKVAIVFWFVGGRWQIYLPRDHDDLGGTLIPGVFMNLDNNNPADAAKKLEDRLNREGYITQLVTFEIGGKIELVMPHTMKPINKDKNATPA